MSSTKKIIDIFTQLAEYNRSLNEVYKVRAYHTAIASLKKLPDDAKFKSCDELLQKYYIHGISRKGSLCTRIDEILQTGKLQELKDLENNKEVKAYRDLMSVKDIGYAFAKKLIKQGIMSVAELKKAVQTGKITLSRNQTLGLIYHHDLTQRVKYNTITKIESKIKKALKPFNVQVMAAGSYRRNSKSKGTSGDIDILVFSRDGVKMSQVIETLAQKEIIAAPPKFFSQGPTKFQGMAVGPVYHQIDIRLIPIESYAPALIYFTGSKNFNQTMRQKAMRMGYKLSEYHLLDLHTKKPVPVKTERDIFKALKMKYVPPPQRM